MAFAASARFNSLRLLGGSSRSSWQAGNSVFVGAAAASLVAATTLVDGSVYADVPNDLHPYTMPFRHKNPFKCYDAHSLRRGYEVYRQVCSTCHSMQYMTFRRLEGHTHTEEQAVALAESYEYDEIADDGTTKQRKGRRIDYFKDPYANQEEARAANNGAAPPDLSKIVLAREGNEHYIFSLLTGYRDPPHGVEVKKGKYYNPYMHGGIIAMTPPLQDDGVEYEDGTPATISQQAKDVTTFLSWVGDPHGNERKQTFWYFLTWSLVFMFGRGYHKRLAWSFLYTRKIRYHW